MKKLSASTTRSLPDSQYWGAIIEGLWHNCNFGILLVNPDGFIVEYNEACSLLLNGLIKPNMTVHDLLGEIVVKETPSNSTNSTKEKQKLSDNSKERLSMLGSWEIDSYRTKKNNTESANMCSICRGTVFNNHIVIRQVPLYSADGPDTFTRTWKMLFISDESDTVHLKEEVNRLRLLNRQMEQIFDASFDEIYVTDAEGNTIKVSRSAYERLHGSSPNAVIGKNVKELEAMGKFWPSVFPRILKEKRPITFIQHTRQGRQMLVTSTPIFDEDERIQMVVSNSRDITELLNLRERLERAQDMVQKYEEEIAALRQEQLRIEGVIAASPQMKNVLYAASKAANTDSTVLILGQTGVGKEVIAKTIHNLSSRSHRPFLKLNCAAIPENLIEAELFGYEKGAFTGARKEGKRGLIELADDGTLFLDEIAEIPLSLQAKFLDILQDRKFMHIGGTKQIQVNTRIIAATNKDLAKMVEKGAFRRDLYYRLMVIPIEIPPLKDRPDDIFRLVNYFLKKFCESLGVKKAFAPEAFDALLGYDWPGNVRELKHTIERLVVMSDSSVIRLEMLPKQIRAAFLECSKNGYENFNGRISCEQLDKPLDNPSTARYWNLETVLAQVEERYLKEAFRRFRSTRKIAKALGISQSSVVRKLKKYDIR